MAKYTQEMNEELHEEMSNRETPNALEQLFDAIAIALIEDDLVNTSDVESNQKFIRDGQLKTGAGSGVLALFQKDIKANQEDLKSYNEDGIEILSSYLSEITNMDTLVVNVTPGTDYTVSINMDAEGLPEGGYNITEFIVQDGTFSNVSQFVPLSQQQSNVDVGKAEEFLDTNIFELLPSGDTRQARIIRFFQELNALLPPLIEDEQWDTDNDGFYDRISGTSEWVGSSQYSKDNSISYAQDNTDGNIDEEDAFIHRLKSTANSTNSTRTIEDIYNTVRPYLRDIWEEAPSLEDERPEYRNQSSGYLKFRNPNQGIIIRNTNKEFVDGLDPNNLTYLHKMDGVDGSANIIENGTGFTITMWVRFLDKVSEGTLFNFGNPLRGKTNTEYGVPDDAFGFSLETFVLKKNQETGDERYPTFGEAVDFMKAQNGNYNTTVFDDSNTARFVRLIVRDNDLSIGLDTDFGGGMVNLKDSCVGFSPNLSGVTIGGKLSASIPLKPGQGNVHSEAVYNLLGATHIPEDFNEWYFICASFNPEINEKESHYESSQMLEPAQGGGIGTAETQQMPDYWLNHVVPAEFNADMPYTSNSLYGNRCKVEIISRSDLLRARGFKVE